MKKFLKVMLIILIVIIVIAAALFAVLKITGRKSDPSEVTAYETDNIFISGDTEKIAHRMGAGIEPEETLMAMERCLTDACIDVDIYEFDMRLTADEELVVIHDLSLDDISDAQEVFGKKGLTVRELTLKELKMLNMGAKFTDANGARPYENSTDERLKILTAAEALDRLTAAGVTRMSIEIKDEGSTGMRGMDILYSELKSRGLLSSVVVSTFKTDVSAYIQEKYPDMIRSNTDAEALRFYLAAMTDDEDYVCPCSVMQFPYTAKYQIMGINFASAKVLDYAHSRNIAVHYWGVNTEEKMLYLRSMGADGVMTDYPDLLTAVYAK